MDINKRYQQLKKNNSNLLKNTITIYTSISIPTDDDYKRGYINRYFLQKVNDTSSPILEVSSKEYSSVKSNALYTGVSLRWRITGPKESVYEPKTGRLIDMGVRESNRKSLELASNNIQNLNLHFPNLTQFWKNI